LGSCSRVRLVDGLKMDKTNQVLDLLLELFDIDVVSLALGGPLLLLGLCRFRATRDMRRHVCVVCLF
jgi:hypothetical protein